MILRHSLSLPHCLALCAVLLFVTQQTSAQDVFDCHITIGDNKYDLAALGGEHTVSRERDTPPTKFRDTVTFNLCEDLKKVDGVPDNEQVSISFCLNNILGMRFRAEVHSSFVFCFCPCDA